MPTDYETSSHRPWSTVPEGSHDNPAWDEAFFERQRAHWKRQHAANLLAGENSRYTNMDTAHVVVPAGQRVAKKEDLSQRALFEPGDVVQMDTSPDHYKVFDYYNTPGTPEAVVLPWWVVPIVDAEGYISFANYQILRLVEKHSRNQSVAATVAEAVAHYEASRVFLDELTGKVWMHTVSDPTRFYCVNDSFVWPIAAAEPLSHWTPLYKKVS